MSSTSTIEWTEATWNPVTGCRKVSAGCDNCYAETFAERWRGIPGHPFEQGFDVRLWPERLTLPLRWRRPRKVFVNSMSDLFIDDVGDEFVAQVFAVMVAAPQHTFQVLTKRHARMRSLLSSEAFWGAVAAELGRLWNVSPPAPLRCAPPWIWLGVSAENQKWADIRIPALIETPATVRFVSAEPLLGPIRLAPHWLTPAQESLAGERIRQGHLDWIIVGGESGPRARPMHPDWARSLRDQCRDAGVAYFFKQWGEFGELPRTLPSGAFSPNPGVSVANDGTVYQPGDLAWPDGSRCGEAIRAGHDKAQLHAMYRVGKKTAGRELDGRTWDEMPVTVGEPMNAAMRVSVRAQVTWAATAERTTLRI